MKFLAIDPKERTTRVVEATEVHEALPLVGLASGKVDHGVVARGNPTSASIVLYEFALFVPAKDQHYFTIGRSAQLYAGAAIIYLFDEDGSTVDYDPAVLPPESVKFFHNLQEINAWINVGHLACPRLAINGMERWRWPNAPPPDLKLAMEQRK